MFTNIPMAITSKPSDHAVDGSNGRTYTHPWNTGDYQQWILVPAGQEPTTKLMYYGIQQVQSGDSLDGGGPKDTTYLNGRPTNNHNQQWSFQDGDGTFTSIIERKSNRALTRSGRELVVRPRNRHDANQRFQVWPVLASLDITPKLENLSFDRSGVAPLPETVMVATSSTIKLSPGGSSKEDLQFSYSTTELLRATFTTKLGVTKGWKQSGTVKVEAPGKLAPVSAEASAENSTELSLDLGWEQTKETQETVEHQGTWTTDIEYPVSEDHPFFPRQAEYRVTCWIDLDRDVRVPFTATGTITGTYKGKKIEGRTLQTLVRLMGFDGELSKPEKGTVRFAAKGVVEGEYATRMYTDYEWLNEPVPATAAP